MDILKVIKWGGYLASLITITTDALGYIDNNTNVIRGMTSAGIGIGLITGTLEKKFTPSSTPYSYLYEACSLAPSGFKNHNNNFYKKMEEFIND